MAASPTRTASEAERRDQTRQQIHWSASSTNNPATQPIPAPRGTWPCSTPPSRKSCLKSIEERTRRHHAHSCRTSTLLRNGFHAVVAPHDGQVDPQRNLHVGMAKPLRDNVQRYLPDHQPMPRSTVPQTMSSCTSLTSPWRLLVETRPLDAIPDVPQRRPHGQRHHLVPGRPVRRPVPANNSTPNR